MLIHQDKNTTKKKVCNPSSLVFQFAIRLPLFLLVQLCFHTTYLDILFFTLHGDMGCYNVVNPLIYEE